MYRIMRKKNAYVLFIFVVAIFFSSYKGASALFSIDKVRWSFDEKLSDLAQKSIIRFAAGQRYNSPASLFKQLKDQFSFIDSVIMHRERNGFDRVHVTAFTPYVVVNQETVIDKNKKETSVFFFKKSAIRGLPSILYKQCSVDECKKSFEKSFLSWITRVPLSLFRSYRVMWEDPNHVWLEDEKDDRFVVLISAKKLLYPNIVKVIEEVKKDFFAQRRTFFTDYEWVMDIRFAHQVVVYKQKKRSCYGENK